MSEVSKRSTVYFEPALHKAIRLKAVHTHRSISDVVNDAVRYSLHEDHVDLDALDARVNEQMMSFRALIRGLKADNKL